MPRIQITNFTKSDCNYSEPPHYYYYHDENFEKKVYRKGLYRCVLRGPWAASKL